MHVCIIIVVHGVRVSVIQYLSQFDRPYSGNLFCLFTENTKVNVISGAKDKFSSFLSVDIGFNFQHKIFVYLQFAIAQRTHTQTTGRPRRRGIDSLCAVIVAISHSHANE